MPVNRLLFMMLWITSCTLVNPYSEQADNVDHFKQTIVVNDEGSVITFSTINGYQKQYGDVVWDDNFFRGFIDKRTGEKSFQVYNVLYYSSSGRGDWRHYQQANYTTPAGQQIAPAQTLRQIEDCSSLVLYGKCIYSEHIAFNVNEQLLNAIAQHSGGSKWMYSLVPQRGEYYPDGLFATEAAALLASMSEYPINTGALSTSRNPTVEPTTQAISAVIPKSQLPPSREIPDGRSVF